MIGSVRARLTLGVVAVVGGLAVTTAIVAPRLVDDALVDDRLDAEIDGEGYDSLGRGSFGSIVGSEFGVPELTAVFGPEIAEVTRALEPTGALAEVRRLHPRGELRVSPAPGVVAIVDDDGAIRFDDDTGEAGPIVTTGRLQNLAVELNVSPRLGGPLEIFRGGDLTFEEFISDVESQFEFDLDDQLDGSVFETFPIFGDDLPQSVFDSIIEGLDEELFVEPFALEPGSSDDYVFGVRSVDGADLVVAAPAEGIDRSVDRVQTALWLAVPVAMLLAGGLTWLLAGRTLRPVRAITERTGSIRAGTLHERVPVPPSHDEVAGLATEMNEMLDRVQREDERRRQFVADASHELRSPIAAIRAQAEATLADPAVEHATTDELATGVLAEAERMGVLVDDLLSLARHDERLAPPGEIIDLDDIVLAEAQRPRRVAVDTTGVSAGRVRGRVDELSRVVAHLLDNATRHAAGETRIALATVGDTVVLTVDDDGPGIAEPERERIFERFVRLDEARERDTGGAGLGLAVVATVVRAGGGEVTAGTSPAGGARFEVRFLAAD